MYVVRLCQPVPHIMGVACLSNAARCRRLHCISQNGSIWLAAVYVALTGFNILPMCPGIFLAVVFSLSCLACCAEVPFGRYWKRSPDRAMNDANAEGSGTAFY